MRRILFMTWIFAWIGFVCCSEGVTALSDTGDSTTSAPAKVETFTGKVDSVAELDGTEGKIQQMTLREDDGKQTVFVIAPDATIMGKDGNPTSLNWIKGNRVSVKYVMAPNGYTKTVKSVQELPES